MKAQIQAIQDRSILEMVRGLLHAEAAFQDILLKYQQGCLLFSDIGGWVDDRGQSLLYRLKEQCHAAFRDEGKRPVHKNEWLLDLAIGSIFHEAMKLRENIYQLEFYQPKYLQFKSKAPRSPYEKDLLKQFERIVSRATQGVQEGMEETRSLFRDTMEQLIDFFRENSNNPLLVRLLLENQPVFRRVYGPKRANEVFKTMYARGLLDAYQLAGRSYLQSAHYDLAKSYFSKALKMDPGNQDLQLLLSFCLGAKAYYKNAYSMTFSHFEKLIPLQANARLKREYLRKAQEICHKISSEGRDERGLAAVRKCRLLADEIKKVL